MAYGLPAIGEGTWGQKILDSFTAVKATADAAQPSATLDAGVTAVDANAASALRVQQDARLSATFVAKGALLLNVKDYGAIGDGVADDTAEIQATINAAAAAGGGVVYLPSGTYKVASTLTVSTNGIYIQGAGAWRTTITRSTDYGDTLRFTGNDATGVYVSDTGVDGLRFHSTGLTTSGAHLNYNGATRHTARNLYFEDGFIGIKAGALTAAYLANIYGVFINLFGGAATGRRFMQFVSAAATYGHPSCGDVFITDFNVRGNVAGTVFPYGIEIQSADGIWFQGGHVGNTTTANIFLNAIDAANAIGAVYFTNVMSDECTGVGLLFSGNAVAGSSIMFANCVVTGGGTGTNGISTSTTAAFYNVQFTGCSVSAFNGHGVNLVSAGCANFSFSNCMVMGNSYTTAGSASGYYLENVKKVQITGGNSGGDNINPEGTVKHAYGVLVAAGVTGITITGVDLRKNVTAGLIVNYASRGEVLVSNCRTDESSSIASAATVTLPEIGDVFTITGTQTIDNVQVSRTGRRVLLHFTGILSVPDAGNLRLAGNLTTTANTTLSLYFDGTNWIETGRSVN